MSILVGTVDARGNPSCCRAIALTSSDDLATLTTYLPVATSQATIANIAVNGRLAIVASHPIDHSSIQLKGTTSGARLAREDESRLVKARLEAFADILDTIGLPRRVVRSVAHWPAFAVEMRVDSVFEQTPGPKAGTRIQ
jgi:hypothetical protein